jgi:hypothetical protein
MPRALLLVLLLAAPAGAIPATPLMTVYRFNGPEGIPYYRADALRSPPAGTLAQGTRVIPCLVLRNGAPLTDRDGTPYVGFEVVIDARAASPADTARFTAVAAERQQLTVDNHHCRTGTRDVISAAALFAMDKPPSFEPPRPPANAAGVAQDRLDAIVRTFHLSPQCERANATLLGRRAALRRAWDDFTAANTARWPLAALRQARQLDYVMRTVLYEGHLGRGCSAYGACERNVIALSIRNRALERCLRGQGCRAEGDFEGVASEVAQYNIWDELLTQTTGLTSCFLRPDLGAVPAYARLQAMYAQSVADVEGILFGGATALARAFPGESPSQLARLRHYYHPPAMGKCFPDDPRLEYVSAAIARRGDDFALIANARVRVDEPRGAWYRFRIAEVEDAGDRDVVRVVDRYPGFVIDGRKIELRRPSGCTPYGTPPGCRFPSVGRYRKTPRWLADGDPLEITCRVRASGESCSDPPVEQTVSVGGPCDTAMQPVAGVR